MQLRTLDIDKMITLYDMREVTSHLLQGPGTLFDPDIFGQRTDNRLRFGYIRLKGHYIDPSTYAACRRLFRDINHIIAGTKKFKIDNGYIKEDPNGDTGLDWFYKNFDSVRWGKMRESIENKDSRMQNQLMKKSFIKLTKKDFFIDKLCVIPVKYRDIDTSKGLSVQIDELNQYYMDLIKFVATKEKFKNNPYMDSFTSDVRIQETLNKVYNYISNQLFLKTGAQRNMALSRSVDNAILTVIVSPEIRMTDTIGKTNHDLNHAEVPLHHYMNGHPVHTVSAVKLVLNQFFNKGLIPVSKDKFDFYYSESWIQEEMVTYKEAPALRLDPVPLPDHKGHIEMWFEHTDGHGKSNIVKRPITWMELFTVATNMFEENTRGILTRYPVISKDSVVSFKFKRATLTTDPGTTKIYLTDEDKNEGTVFEKLEDYPDVSTILGQYGKKDIPTLFQETTRFNNMYLEGLDGDYKYHCSL